MLDAGGGPGRLDGSQKCLVQGDQLLVNLLPGITCCLSSDFQGSIFLFTELLALLRNDFEATSVPISIVLIT